MEQPKRTYGLEALRLLAGAAAAGLYFCCYRLLGPLSEIWFLSGPLFLALLVLGTLMLIFAVDASRSRTRHIVVWSAFIGLALGVVGLVTGFSVGIGSYGSNLAPIVYPLLAGPACFLIGSILGAFTGLRRDRRVRVNVC
jgi:hypothetical protein